MTRLSIEKIQAYRQKTFRLLPKDRVISKEEAIAFVNERGFIHFWPIKEITLPSLWVAVAGDRPVADAHDDPGHVTWGWKDSLLGGHHWYYAKVLRKRATMIAMDIVPFFYALSENYGAPEEDYLTLYEQGRMTQEAKWVYEALLTYGPLDTIALREAAHLAKSDSKSRFERALVNLQADFKILPVGVAEVGAWRYAFRYNIVAYQYPDIPDQAQTIQEKAAYQKLAGLYFRSVGASQISDLVRLFGWRTPATEGAVNALVEDGILCRHIKIDKWPGEWIALTILC